MRQDGLIFDDLAFVIAHHQFLDWNRFDPRFNAAQKSVVRFRVAQISTQALAV
jgi:hypothetical protein